MITTMVKWITLTALLAMLFFYACKAERKQESNLSAPPVKPNSESMDLELYNESNLIATIHYAESDSTSVDAIKRCGRSESNPALLVDLLKTYKLDGKNVVLSGPIQSTFLSVEEATKNQVSLCRAQEGFFRAYDQARTLRMGELTKIQVTEREDQALRVGDPVPDLTLISLDGKSQTKLKSLIGPKPLVLIFGSFT